MKKPSKCCDIGTYEHTIPMPVKGKVQGIDLCIADIVAALNAANITTVNSCCGHGTLVPTILLDDDRFIVILSREQFISSEYKASMVKLADDKEMV